VKWIGDCMAGVEGERRPEPTVDLREQHLAGRHAGGVELSERTHAVRIRGGGKPEKYVGPRNLALHRNHLIIIAGS